MKGRILQIFSSMTHNIDEDFKHLSLLNKIFNQHKIKFSWFFLGLIFLMITFTLFGWFQNILVTIFAMIYPAYMSFQSINLKTENKEQQWLSYWILFGILSAFDKFLQILLFFLPAFYSFKVLFFLWLFYPRTKGSQKIYHSFLKPQITRLKEFIINYKFQ